MVDVINNIPGYGVTLHWRGQPNNEAPFMDGVPMVTQCAIPSFTTFQYKFRASSPGTHFYHAFSDKDRTRGLFGALVIREADKADPHRNIYDEDPKNNVIMISEWSSSDGMVKSILVNGKGPPSTAQMETFHVKQGKRYRFRVAYTAGTSPCPLVLKIEDHLLKVITLDGNPVEPFDSSFVTISKGERLDFVLNAVKISKSYELSIESQCEGGNISGKAFVNYDGVQTTARDRLLLVKKDQNVEDDSYHRQRNDFIIDNLRYLRDIDVNLKNEDVNHKFYFGYDYGYYEYETITGECFYFYHL